MATHLTNLKTSEVLSQLHANDLCYQATLAFLTRHQDRLSPDGVLEAVDQLSYFATQHHTGRFSDGALEDLAIHIGLDMKNPVPPPGLKRQYHQTPHRL